MEVRHQPFEATRKQSTGHTPIIGGPPLPSLESRQHGLNPAFFALKGQLYVSPGQGVTAKPRSAALGLGDDGNPALKGRPDSARPSE